MKKRGDVYWFNMEEFCKQGKFKTKVLLKKRPYLIVSNDDWNEVSGLVTVVPISSKERFNSDSHVVFNSADRKLSVIVTEHIATVDQDLLGDYKETLDESVMLQVDDAIQKHLGFKDRFSRELNDFFCSSTDILEMFSQMIDKIMKKKFQEERKKLMVENVDNVALRLASTIEDLFDIKSDNNTQNDTYNNTQDIVDNANNIQENNIEVENKDNIRDTDNIEEVSKNELSTDEESNKPTEMVTIEDDTGLDTETEMLEKPKKQKVKRLKLPRSKGNKKILWTHELKKEFVENSKKFTTEEMCIMYNYTKGSYYSALYSVKKSLEKTENLQKSVDNTL